MATEAASLFVSVTADTDKAIRGLQGVNTQTEKTGGFLKTAAGMALGFGGAMLALQGTSAVFGAFKSGAIDMNAELETSTLQFTTLMGDADKAEEHVRSLFDFAARTPFETGPIIEASRLMETFGGSALNSKKNLGLFGDAAAATGQPINEVAFWMSRAYAAIQAGKPWGEAAQRLGEMGIVTPKVRTKLEEMAASGAKGSDVWQALTGDLGKFSGAMERQAETFDGQMSTLSDGINMALATGFKPFFNGLKGMVSGLNNLMSTPAFQGALVAIADGIAGAFGLLGDAFGVVSSALGPVLGLLGELFGMFRGGSAAIGGFAQTFDTLHEKVLTMLGGAIDWVLNEGVPAVAEALNQFALKFIEWIGPAAEQLGAALPLIAENLINFIGTYGPVIAAKLVEWAGAFVGWIATNVLPRLPGMLSAVGGAILGWIGKTAPVVAARLGDMASNALARVGEILPKLPSMVGQFLGQAVGVIAAKAPGFISAMLGMAGNAIVAFIGAMGQLVPKFLGIAGSLLAALPGFGAKLVSGAMGAAGDFVRGFISGLGSLPGKFLRAVANAIRSIFPLHIGPLTIGLGGVSIDLPKISLPGFATGAWNLPRDMVANVHKGEMIIPADIASRLRGGHGFGGGMADSSGGGGGGDVLIINIGDFHGTEDNIQSMSEAVAQQVRMSRPKRTVFA